MNESASESTIRRILIRGVNWLGDAVMTTPALLRLREAHPGARITLFTPDKLADLWQNHPALDAIETFNAAENVWQIGRRLSRGNFDTALVLPNSPRSALEVRLALIPRRIGYNRAWRNWLLTDVIQSSPDAVAMHKRSKPEIEHLIQQNLPGAPLPLRAHHIHHYLHLAAAMGANPEPLPPLLKVSEEAVARFIAKFKLDRNSSQAAPCFGLNPAAEYGPAKRWPEERFTEAAIEIQRQTGCRWLIFGLKSDAEMGARIAAAINRANQKSGSNEAMNLAGATTLGELCAALKFCRVLLTNDSGPMHLAALGTPVVVPFGSTSPELTGPGLPGDIRHKLLRVDAPCSPCFLRECPIDFRCMTGISVEAVVRVVLEIKFGD